MVNVVWIGGEITWSCHFCGAVRPDAAISVASKVTYFGTEPPRIQAQHNRRFCNDSVKCWTLAEEWRTSPDT